MNKSGEKGIKDEMYFINKEEENLVKFCKLFEKLKQENEIFKDAVTGGTEQYEVYDAWMKVGGFTYIIELKDREYKHTDFRDWMIEPDRLLNMLKVASDKYIPVYLNFYTDGYALRWDLRDNLDAKMAPKKNAQNKGFSTHENNSNYLLPSNRARVYRYE